MLFVPKSKIPRTVITVEAPLGVHVGSMSFHGSVIRRPTRGFLVVGGGGKGLMVNKQG